MTAPSAMASELMAHNAWVRETPPMMKISAAFMMLHNRGPEHRYLTGGSSPQFEKVELHRTMPTGNGVMRMVPQQAITVPAMGMAILKPGDYHIMLLGRKTDLRAGDHVDITLSFKSGETMELKLPVKKMVGMGRMRHHKMNHSMMNH
uniref:Copper chaperone PCu(A)C n=1 Tax=Magnetococcus massalia (strain MO-1) TaxID=451514 RepID=A0A1S7LFP1_MAGMO|nr:Conserved protein of unknown function. Containing DR1885-like metal-binding domain [Candidatus Magnetococcus massalia]